MTTPRKPRISIVLATYRRVSFLKRCLESVLAQDHQDFELIVIDDGSEDGTEWLVADYRTSDVRLRYSFQNNQGQCAAKNAGMKLAQGDYITFIDSDDYYKPGHLSSRLAYVREHPEVDLIAGGFEPTEETWVVDYFDRTRLVNIEDCVLGATFFGKRDVFLKLGGFRDMIFGEDTDFWARAEKEFRTARIVEPRTYVYSREDPNSITKIHQRRVQSVHEKGGSTMSLKNNHCAPCEGGVPKMTAGEIAQSLAEVPGWEAREDRLKRLFKFKDFVEAMTFVNAMARVAEAEGHHPDFSVHYNQVEVTLWTHAVGGLSRNDFILAAKLNEELTRS